MIETYRIIKLKEQTRQSKEKIRKLEKETEIARDTLARYIKKHLKNIGLKYEVDTLKHQLKEKEKELKKIEL